MAKKAKHIPEYQLPQSEKDGIHIVSHEEFGFNASHDTSAPHRDEHYLMIVSCRGSVEAVIDFDSIKISSPFIALISPAQVMALPTTIPDRNIIEQVKEIKSSTAGKGLFVTS